MLTRSAAGLVVAVLAGGTAGSTEQSEPAAPNEVLIVMVEDDPDAPFAFEPTELTVSGGATVRWRNTTDRVFHTVTFTDSLDERVANGVFDHSVFMADDIVEYTIDEPGTYAYFCQPHSTFMAGTIIVTEPDQDRPFWHLVVVYVGIFVVAVIVGLTVRSRRAPTAR